jgi:exodeoxyribonuclease V alpha subunit
VLADLIRSGRSSTFELTEIFRQDEQSPIVINAHRVRNGQPPVIEPARRSRRIVRVLFH